MTRADEFAKVERYFDARDKNGELYLASSGYPMDKADERGRDWILASDYDAAVAALREAEERIWKLEHALGATYLNTHLVDDDEGFDCQDCSDWIFDARQLLGKTGGV